LRRLSTSTLRRRAVDQPRKERVARNEAAYRELNERIAGSADDPSELLLLCECGEEDCADAFVVDAERYEAVRRDPRRFFLLRGHELPHVERVIEDRGRCIVVEKTGDAADIAEARDPRD
jgi:hypothetical protein